MSESIDWPKSNRNKLTAVALTGAIALGGLSAESADASTNPCPRPNKLAAQGISPACNEYLMSELDNAGYDDVSPNLRVATYQKLAEGLNVDGALGPMTGRSILRGVALHIKAPFRNKKGKKIVVDKKEQVAYLTNRRGRLNHIISVSTGTEKHFSDTDKLGNVHEGTAHTPTGNFIIREEAGPDYDSDTGLGPMPWAEFFGTRTYFSHNFAVHGGYVDYNGRDSHGCVRVSNDTMAKYVAPYYNLNDKVIIRKKVKV